MKRTSLILYLGVLILSLVLAYFSWTAAPAKPGEKATILECGKGELQKLVLKEKDRTVTFVQKTAPWSGKQFWWVEASREPLTPPKEDKKPAADSIQTSPELFKGNASLAETLANFCPWKGLRSLGKVSEDKQREFGLKKEGAAGDYLEMEFTSGAHRFLLGEASFGPKDRYVLDTKTGGVFLVEGQSIKDLLYPKSRFMDRSLQAFKKEDIRRLRLTAGGREKELVRPAAAPAAAGAAEKGAEEGWADAKSPEQSKEIYGNWLRKVLNLRPIDYVAPAERSAPGDSGCAVPAGAETVASLTFYGDKAEIGFLTLYKTTDAKGNAEFLACTENTTTLVKISKTQTEGVLKDMEDVLSES